MEHWASARVLTTQTLANTAARWLENIVFMLDWNSLIGARRLGACIKNYTHEQKYVFAMRLPHI